MHHLNGYACAALHDLPGSFHRKSHLASPATHARAWSPPIERVGFALTEGDNTQVIDWQNGIDLFR
jgi:hypothetical protein